MKVLLLGSGGREHAIGWKLVQSHRVNDLISLPGNPGLAELGAVVEGINPTDVGAVAAFAKAQGVDLVVVGPEAPLAAGVVDALTAFAVPVFGPTKAAAQLESSKTFAKEVMDRANVPTAAWGSFNDQAAAREYLRSQSAPYVIKADGLAAGKGVLVTESLAEADQWVEDCLGGRFGEGTVLIERYLAGPEVSVFAVCDGDDAVLFEPARDYKRLKNADIGPNTGGMGSYSPISNLPAYLMDFTLDRVVRPVLEAMAQAGTPYVGFLYVGYVLTADGPVVLEFNCRLGDPETQVVLPRLETDLLTIIDAAMDGSIGDITLKWTDQTAVNVVLAAEGYPDSPVKGTQIKGLESTRDVMIFHGGTREDIDGRILTDGGRVLSVVAVDESAEQARSRCYEALDTLRWPGMQYRSDIARNP